MRLFRCCHPKNTRTIILCSAALLVLVILYRKLTSHPTSLLYDPDYDPFGLRDSKFSGSFHEAPPPDIHLDDGRVLGVGEHHHGLVQGREGTRIAIGLAITSRGVDDVPAEQVRYKFPFFRSLLPSICKTSSQGYSYHFYLAFDAQDPYFSNSSSLAGFTGTFSAMRREVCSFVNGLELHLVRCTHAHKPAWAQNDAMFEAYLDNMDYYYRVNDDTYVRTPGWTLRFISTLQGFHPPNVGVVGPKQEGGKSSILTYDFVHRTHLDLFGFYYPRAFTDWWGDDWMTTVYQPGRSEKVLDSRVLHTQEHGTRYSNQFGRVQFLAAEIADGKKLIERYVASVQESTANNHTEENASNMITMDTRNVTNPKVKLKEAKVIAMSLYGNLINQTYGAIRNVNLAKLFFPGWTVRIYTENSINETVLEPVSERILQKLQYLGAEVHFISRDFAQIVDPEYWHYQVADDTSLDRFIVRNPESRLSEKDARIVELWEKSGAGFHCIRDHVNHARYAMVNGLWGGRQKKIQEVLKQGMENELVTYFKAKTKSSDRSESHSTTGFLTNILWEKIQGTILCHDSVACEEWSNSVGVPWQREAYEYIGQKYDAWGRPVMEEVRDNSTVSMNCVGIT